MGYLSYLSGRIEIDPPLRWSEFKDSPFRKGAPLARESGLVLEEQDQTTETDEGVIERRWAIALVPASDDGLKYSRLDVNLASFVHEHGDARTLSGYLVREGESQGDVERYSITDDGGVRTEKAVLRWPDGTAVRS